MPELIIYQDKLKKITNPDEVIKLCPFGAIQQEANEEYTINAACKLCGICVKKGPEGAFEIKEDEAPKINKDEWKGILVYVEHDDQKIHPVTFELLGKAKELAEKINHPVYALYIGSKISEQAKELYEFGAEKVFVYDYPELKDFRIEPYAACFEEFINKNKPSTILVGGTTIGRSLAPRVAARIHTGLTADCTILDMQENTDLDQIRPAFGGNIMAHIQTPNHRPQFATVRYKIFDALEACASLEDAEIVKCEIDTSKLTSKITIIETKPKPKVKSIEDAEMIVVAGRGVKKEEDLSMIEEFAQLINAEFATTRPLMEAGWSDSRRQIGLSGRTVKPKLIITIGVSGSIQFKAGMQNSDVIIAINTDPHANIMNIAHYCIVGDLYKILPPLVEKLKNYKPAIC